MHSWEELWQGVDFRFLEKFMTHGGIGLGNKVRIKIAEIINTFHEPSIVDIGCGPGLEYCSLALRVMGNFQYTGVDFADNMLEVARLRASIFGRDNFNFVKGDLYTLPTDELKAGTFDVLVSKDVLEHLPPPCVHAERNYKTAVKHFVAMKPQHILLGFHLGLGTEGEDIIKLCDDKLYRNIYLESTMFGLLEPEYACEVIETPTETIFGPRPARVIWGERDDS